MILWGRVHSFKTACLSSCCFHFDTSYLPQQLSCKAYSYLETSISSCTRTQSFGVLYTVRTEQRSICSPPAFDGKARMASHSWDFHTASKILRRIYLSISSFQTRCSTSRVSPVTAWGLLQCRIDVTLFSYS